MTDDPSHCDPLDQIAEEFVASFRRREMPSLTEYADKYPELADDIRDLFPTLLAMEGALIDQRDGDPAGVDGQPLRQLGEYRILREIGRGGMGVVYEAEQESLGRHVALKVLPFAATMDRKSLQRFRRESRSAAKLHHTSIVPVFGVGEENGVHYYAMQFIQGQGLDEVLVELRRIRRVGGDRTLERPEHTGAGRSDITRRLAAGHFDVPAIGPEQADDHQPVAASPDGRGENSERRITDTSVTAVLPGDEVSPNSQSHGGQRYYRSVARIALQVAEALAYAHSQRVLHRDIKPSNLLLDGHGTVWVILGDFSPPIVRARIQIENIQRSLRGNPKNAGAANSLAWIYATGPEAVRDAPGALKWANVAVESAPSESSYWNTLGAAQYRSGQHEAALTSFRHGIELRGEANAFDFFFMAMCCARLNQTSQSTRHYDDAIRWWRSQASLRPQWTADFQQFRAEADAVLAEGPGTVVPARAEAE